MKLRTRDSVYIEQGSLEPPSCPFKGGPCGVKEETGGLGVLSTSQVRSLHRIAYGDPRWGH